MAFFFLGGKEIEKHLWSCCNICEYSWLFFSVFHLLCAIWMFSSPNSDLKWKIQLIFREKKLAVLVISRAELPLLWQRQEWPRSCSAWAAMSAVICQPAHNQVISCNFYTFNQAWRADGRIQAHRFCVMAQADSRPKGGCSTVAVFRAELSSPSASLGWFGFETSRLG